MVCQDEVTSKYNLTDAASAERYRDQAEKLFGGCVNTCVDKHLSLLKSIQANIEKEVSQIANSKR